MTTSANRQGEPKAISSLLYPARENRVFFIRSLFFCVIMDLDCSLVHLNQLHLRYYVHAILFFHFVWYRISSVISIALARSRAHAKKDLMI